MPRYFKIGFEIKEGSFKKCELQIFSFESRSNFEIGIDPIPSNSFQARGHSITTWTRRGDRGSVESPKGEKGQILCKMSIFSLEVGGGGESKLGKIWSNVVVE